MGSRDKGFLGGETGIFMRIRARGLQTMRVIEMEDLPRVTRIESLSHHLLRSSLSIFHLIFSHGITLCGDIKAWTCIPDLAP